MKTNLIAFLAWFCCALSASAQNYFSLTSAQNNKVYSGFEAFLEIPLELHNSTLSIKNYGWERTNICQMPSGWSAYVCDCDNCYPPEAYIKPTQGTVVDSCTILFTYQFDLGASLGSHTTKLRFYDPTNSLAWDDIFLTINNGCPTLLNNRDQTTSFLVNLNNSEGKAYIQSMTESNGVRIEVNDLSGRTVALHRLNYLTSGDKIYLEVSHAGVYVVNVYSSQGQKMGSYKMIKL